MSTTDLVTSPHLLSVLSAAETARLQTEAILALLASNKDQSASAALHTQEKRVFSQLALVRGLNRKAVLDVRRTKQETADARHEVDTLHLQLQNLYYEQRHLRGEIALCEGYECVDLTVPSRFADKLTSPSSHSYKKLPLISSEDFLTAHPEHDNLDEHALMNARIEHEHKERLALEEARQSLLKRKQTLIAENNRRKEFLANLDRKIEDWIEGSGAVEKEFTKCGDEMGKIGVVSS